MTQVYMRPIEITAANDGFTVEVGGGGAQAKTIPNGVYASIWMLIYAFRKLLNEEDAAITVTIDTSGASVFNTIIFRGPVGDIEIVFDNEDLPLILGFDDTDMTGKTLVTFALARANRTPLFCWLPSYQSADREYWQRRQKDAFKGSMAQNGRLAGITAGPTIRYREFTFQVETARKTYLSAAVESFTIDTLQFPEQDRCFEHFMEQCRQVMPTVAGNPSPKGFYYFPDRDKIPLTPAGLPFMDSGGTNFDLEGPLYTGPADEYVFCHADVAGAPDPKPAQENNRDYFEINFTAHTATAPTWTSP